MAETLADFEPLLPDSRVEKIWETLLREFNKLPRVTQIATYIQPEKLVPSQRDRQQLVMRRSRAVFLVLSPHPHKRYKGQILKTVMTMPIDDWRDEEKEAGHFVGKGEPALRFFRRMAREHITTRKNFEELD